MHELLIFFLFPLDDSFHLKYWIRSQSTLHRWDTVMDEEILKPISRKSHQVPEVRKMPLVWKRELRPMKDRATGPLLHLHRWPWLFLRAWRSLQNANRKEPANNDLPVSQRTGIKSKPDSFKHCDKCTKIFSTEKKLRIHELNRSVAWICRIRSTARDNTRSGSTTRRSTTRW